MKRGNVLTTFIIFYSISCLLSSARAQSSRAATAASYLDRGAAWISKGELDRAIADFDLAIASDPTLAVAFYNRGSARSQKRDLEGALDLDRAIQLDTRLAEAWVNLKRDSLCERRPRTARV